MKRQIKLGTEVRYENGEVSGWLEWPGNLVFRPTIGVFVDGTFYCTLRCRFADIDAGGIEGGVTRWAFQGHLNRNPQPSSAARITVSCLELGRVLFVHDGAPAQSETVAAIDRLMDKAQMVETSAPVAGFLEFLTLPIVDQLQILYISILGRALDPHGLQSRVGQLLNRSVTILDVRDDLMSSDELRDQRPPMLDQAIGHWCFWSGLKDVVPQLLLPDMEEFATGASGPDQSFERVVAILRSRKEIGDYFLHLAHAQDGSMDARERWLHRISPTIISFSSRWSRRAGEPGTGVRGWTRPLLNLVSIGEVGLRKNGFIVNQPQKGGVLAYGPYLRLDSGGYAITVAFEVLTARDGAALELEIVADDVIFGCASWSVANVGLQTQICSFNIPDDGADFVRNLRYEARLQLEGVADVRIASIKLEKVSAEPGAYPAIENWLAFQSVGDNAERLLDGVVSSVEGSPVGHMIFGPYATLLAGHYEFDVDVIASGRPTLEVEIVGASDEVLATRAFTLGPNTRRIYLPFIVPGRQAGKSDVTQLEFRLKRVTTAGAIVVAATRVVPALSGSAESGALDAEGGRRESGTTVEGWLRQAGRRVSDLMPRRT